MTVMFLIVLIVSFLHVTYNFELNHGCFQEDSGWGFSWLFCSNVQYVQVQQALKSVIAMNQTIKLRLLRVQMNHLLLDFPAELNLMDLEVVNCSVSAVDKNVFANVGHKLEKLSLGMNALKRVPSRAIRKLTSLKILDLSFNKLEFLHSRAFKGLCSLEGLHLENNKIKSIHIAAFAGIEIRLKWLYLDNNKLTTIPYGALRNLDSVNHLSLSHNCISPSLAKAFKPQEEDLKSEIDKPATNSKPGSHLVFSRNLTPRLPATIFMHLLQNLSTLSLSNCGIESIDSFAFQGIEDSLVSLKLSCNLLVEVPVAALKNLKKLRTLNLNNNKIRALRKNDFQPFRKSLRKLLIEKNPLTYVDPMTFVKLDFMTHLLLRNNQLATLPYGTYEHVLNNLKVFQISGNPLHCDCRISWIRDYTYGGPCFMKEKDKIRCSSPIKYKGRPLKEIPRDDLSSCSAESSDASLQNFIWRISIV